MYKHYIKRFIDFTLSLIGIIILSIPMLIIAVIIKIDSPGPVFFLQKRVGLHKHTFNIIKFRSMPLSAPHDTPTHQLTSEQISLTHWQRWMRHSSLDEIPQLFNIFLSQMSIIGPRPALWNQYDLINERDKYGANDIKPGLTGWAQINGRDELEIDVKAKFDGEYAKNLSFAFDCKCFFKTIKSVLCSDGIVDKGIEVIDKEKKEIATK